MQYCGNCGTKVIEGSSFCNNCGVAIPDLKKIQQPAQIPITMSAVNIITQGIDILRAIPKLLWIVVVIGILDIVVYFISEMMFSSVSTVMSADFYMEILYMNPNEIEALFRDLIGFAIVNIFLSAIIGIISTSWILTTYKEIHLNQKSSTADLDLSKTFFDSIPYLLKLFVQRIIFVLIIVLALLIPIFVMVFFFSAAFSTPLALLFMLVIFIILFYVLIRYFYIEQALILDNVGVFESFSRSSQFTKKYFWSTAGAMILFMLLSGITGFIPTSWIIISLPLTRFFQLLQYLGFSWAYATFRDL